jgi:hypothetical protein
LAEAVRLAIGACVKGQVIGFNIIEPSERCDAVTPVLISGHDPDALRADCDAKCGVGSAHRSRGLREQEQRMKKRHICPWHASFILTGVSAPGFAAGGSLESQQTTETQTGSQQLGKPATGSAPTVNGINSRSTMSGTTGTVGMQSNPDATHPTAPQPSGGGTANDGGSSGASR